MATRAFIFDVDGTLADTEREGHRVAFNLAFRDAGLDWTWGPELYGRLLAVTGGRERIMQYWQEVDPSGASRPGAGTRASEAHAAKTRYYVEMVDQGKIELRIGVARFIAEARDAGARLAIATTTSTANVAALLRNTLGETAPALFECIATGDAVDRKKPDPAVYRWVLERMRLRAAECVAFEDSAPGFAAAVGAGVPTVVVTNGYSGAGPFAGAIAVIDGFGATGHPAAGHALGRRWTGLLAPREVMDWAAYSSTTIPS